MQRASGQPRSPEHPCLLCSNCPVECVWFQRVGCPICWTVRNGCGAQQNHKKQTFIRTTAIADSETFATLVGLGHLLQSRRSFRPKSRTKRSFSYPNHFTETNRTFMHRYCTIYGGKMIQIKANGELLNLAQIGAFGVGEMSLIIGRAGGET